jgi:hypothetical protein
MLNSTTIKNKPYSQGSPICILKTEIVKQIFLQASLKYYFKNSNFQPKIFF